MKNDKQPTVSTPELEGAEVLSSFRFVGNECWVVQLKHWTCNVPEECQGSCALFSEICRFEVDGRICAIIRKTISETDEQDSVGSLLTARELQIATLVAMGCPNKQVADKLSISEWTVATYLRRMFAKLGVESRAAMTYRCASLIGGRESSSPSAISRPT